jgi:hypothetical protein
MEVDRVKKRPLLEPNRAMKKRKVVNTFQDFEWIVRFSVAQMPVIRSMLGIKSM